MGFKDKADVMQGIAGTSWILLILSGYLGIFTISVPWIYALIYSVLVILGAYIVYLKEAGGTDLFGILSIGWGVVMVFGLVIFQLAFLNPSFMPIARFIETYLGETYISTILSLVVGVGLLLEAFDVIKPIK